MFSIKTILHPTDFSERSRNAYDVACNMAAQQGARVILLHVASPPPAAAPMPYDAAAINAGEINEEELRAQLEEYRLDKPGMTMETRLARGNPSEVILQVAKEENCDAIVMGTHGRTGVSRLLMGSVAEYVIRDAPCPVITVKDPMFDESATGATPATTAT